MTTKEQARKRKEAGLCANCPGAAFPGRARCQDCHGKFLEAQRIRRRIRIAAGFCPCGKPSATGKRLCARCKEMQVAAAMQWGWRNISLGLCRCGGVPVDDGKTCRDCRNQQAAKHQRLRADVFAHYGGFRCACCGEATPEFLEIDHIDGGGTKHRAEIGGRFYAWLRRNGFPPGFQVLCSNCNIAKARHGICPHQRLKLKDA
jgi:hypothetical protein